MESTNDKVGYLNLFLNCMQPSIGCFRICIFQISKYCVQHEAANNDAVGQLISVGAVSQTRSSHSRELLCVHL